MLPLRIALVSAYPPSTAPLSEYGWHLVEALKIHPAVERVWVLADRAPGACAYEQNGVHVVPCWTFGSPAFPFSILRAARRLHTDLLWFNLHMTSTGNSRASWFAGLTAPACARAAGHRVLVTLHNMLGLTNLESAGIRAHPWDVGAAHAATSLLCAANAIAVLRGEYLDLLRSRYKARHVFHVPHGSLGEPLGHVPDPHGPVARRSHAELLAFGHFGTYKRLEPLIDAVGYLRAGGYDVRLTVGGTDSRHSPGYLAGLSRRYAGAEHITFLGYVAEQDVPALFQRATLCVLPYATMTGTSGVAILCAMHGLPMIASDIAAFRALEREGLRLRFFAWPDCRSLAAEIASVLAAPETVAREREANLEFARAQSMDRVVARYVELADAIVSGGVVDVRTQSAPDGGGATWPATARNGGHPADARVSAT